VEKREPTAYEKFVEATKRVVSIPIAEVDKAAKEWRAKRKRRRSHQASATYQTPIRQDQRSEQRRACTTASAEDVKNSGLLPGLTYILPETMINAYLLDSLDAAPRAAFATKEQAKFRLKDELLKIAIHKTVDVEIDLHRVVAPHRSVSKSSRSPLRGICVHSGRLLSS